MERQIRLFGNACETVRGQSSEILPRNSVWENSSWKPGELVRGDEVVITGPTTGALIVRADDIRVGRKECGKAVKGDAFSLLPCRRKYAPCRQALPVVAHRTMKTLYVSDLDGMRCSAATAG